MVEGNGGNQFGQYAGKITGNQNGYNAVHNVGNQNVNLTRNSNVVAARAGGNGNGNNEAGIQLQAEEFDLMVAVGDIDEIKEVNANCILMANLQQASTSGTQTDKAPIYDSDGSTKISVFEKENERLLRTVVSQDIMSIVQSPSVVETSDPQTEFEHMKERVDITAKTKRPWPRSNINNDRVPSTSKSSCIKNKEVEVEDHHRNLLISKNKKHMSSECNNIKLAIWNDTFEVVCAMSLKKFLGTIHFGNDHIAAILGYGDLQWGNILITRVYFIKGLGYNLFSVGQFCDSDLEVALRRNTCFVRNLEGVDLLKGNRKKQSINPQTQTNSKLKAEATPALNGFMRAEESRKYQRKTKSDISFLHVFGALCYPKNDHEDIGKLGMKGDIGFFIGYSANPCAYIVYNKRTRKIMETMNITFDELSAMAFEQRSSKPGLQGMTSGQISSGLDLTYAPLTITSQKPTERELELLFEAMYDDYIGGQPSVDTRTAPADLTPQVLQTLTVSTTTVDTALTPTNSSSQAEVIPNTSRDVDELQQQHVQQQNVQAQL
ncbi:hypothetical protein Tco_1391614 [Tanacetum coccineum]